MQFGLGLSPSSNPDKTGEGADLALARFPQVLANLFKLNAHYQVPRTLS